ncbi:MAG: DMT family transporter [Desulfurococcales archaeon]|nr:DMT family transporter [Desulfurococcales archaeon]
MQWPLEGLAAAFASGLFFGLSDVLVRLASRGLRPEQNLLLSLAIGLPVLTFLALAFGGPCPGGRALIYYSLAGLVNFVIGRLLFYVSITYAGVATASVLTTPTIILASLLAWPVLGEPLSPRVLAGLILVVVGIYLVKGKPSGEAFHGGNPTLGIIAGLSSSLAFAVSALLVRSAGGYGGGDPLWGSAVSYATALPFALALCLARTGCRGWERESIAYMSGGASIVALAQASRYLALSIVPVAIASALIALFPLHTVAFARLMGRKAREEPGIRHVASAGLAVSGVLLAIY